ncbi:uncharacterized protein LOC141719376 [Apium graveolens]|uniref:uncharacterized protein LOC141719376 n=1 Tax=Apium graveolens TaxID=4045 RepID=UPI003D7BF95A
MRQRRWLELIKYYDCSSNYHLGKANAVVDALRRKERLNVLKVVEELAKKLKKLGIEIRVPRGNNEQLYEIIFHPELMERIKKCQEEDMNQGLDNWTGEEVCTQKDIKGMFRFSSRIWIPNTTELKNEILREANNSKFSLHPGRTKMYQDLKNFWWPRMKREEITVDFVVGIPRTKSNHDAIWIIVDRLMNSAHFLPINERYSLDKLVKMYLDEIVTGHEVPILIISD